MEHTNYTNTSSGRWDASGNWNDAVEGERIKASYWAMGLSKAEIRKVLTEMADDPNSYTTYQRRAVMLYVVEEFLA